MSFYTNFSSLFSPSRLRCVGHPIIFSFMGFFFLSLLSFVSSTPANIIFLQVLLHAFKPSFFFSGLSLSVDLTIYFFFFLLLLFNLPIPLLLFLFFSQHYISSGLFTRISAPLSLAHWLVSPGWPPHNFCPSEGSTLAQLPLRSGQFTRWRE